MKRLIMAAVVAASLACAGPGPALAQTPAEKAAQQRENADRLGQFLASNGGTVHIAFKQSQKVPTNYTGVLETGLKNCDYLEIVFGASQDNTLAIMVYPHIGGRYLNIEKARDRTGLMRQMLHYNDTNFFGWGADSEGDVFARYTITLESGFPVESMKVVLFSIVSQDGYAGTLNNYM